MTLERILLIAGRILSVLFAIILIVHVVFTVMMTSVVSAAATTPQTFALNLQDEDFQAEIGSAALAVLLNALPPELQIGNTAISTPDLVNALLAVEWREFAAQLGSGNLINAFISDVLNSLVSEVRGDVQQTVSQQASLLSDRLSGRPAYEIAQLIVSAVQACTQDQTDRLLAAAESSNFTAIDFICNPTSSGDNLPGVMRDIIVIGLGNLADALIERADEAIASLNIQDIQIETPIGIISLDWPEIVLTKGNLSVNLPLPQNLVDTVEGAVGNLQGLISNTEDQLNAQVEQSQAELEALATQIVTDIQTTGTAAAAPTLTPTPTATETPVPAAVDAPPSNLSIAINTALSDLTVQLVALANSINSFLWVGLVLDVVITFITVLFMLRRWLHMGLWTGIVLLVGGIGILLSSFGIGSGLSALAITPYPHEIPEIAQLQTTLRTSLANALNAGFQQPLLLQSVVLIVLGVLLIGTVYYFWRKGQQTEVPPDAQESVPPEAQESAPS